MHHILPPSTPTNPIKLAKTHTHAVNHSRSYPPYQYFSSISLSYFPGLRTLHTACIHCSPCSFLAPLNQSQQVTFIPFLHLMLHQTSWLAGTDELLCSPLMLWGLAGWGEGEGCLLVCLFGFLKGWKAGCKIWVFIDKRTPKNCVHAYKTILLIVKYC